MKRKASSRSGILRLPISKKGITNVDDNASDGYDQPGRLVIDSSNNFSENVPSGDSTEHLMKTGSDQEKDGHQQEQLCQIDLGNQCYVVGKTFNGQMLIHVRKYDRRDDGTLFPTKKGIALNLEKWKKLQYWFLDLVDKALKEYRDSKQVDIDVHLGENYRVTVKSGYPLVNIRRWFIPDGQEKLVPTKTGIALTFEQWDKQKSDMPIVEELLNGELDKVIFCEELHQNQEGALTCSYCNPMYFMNY